MNRISRLAIFFILFWFSVVISYAGNRQPVFKKYILLRVIDGDTMLISDGTRQKLRLIGIDTPEPWFKKKMERDAARAAISTGKMKRLGQSATKFVRDYLLKYYGKKITVELGREQHDKYGRLLGYLWLPNGRMLNREILKAGYAKVMSIPPNTKYYREFIQLKVMSIPPNTKYYREFIQLGEKARRSHLGIWKQLKKW